MSDFLQRMAASSRQRAIEARCVTPMPEMRRAAEQVQPARKLKITDRPGVIAEIKRSAPSAGELRTEVDVAARAAAYEEGGAIAISVLTEPTEFRGELADLRNVSQTANAPVMRKDFLVDPYQLYEARANGADGALLIAAILADDLLREMLQTAEYLGMFALVEAFDEVDIERAQCAGAELVGVNCRDLRDLSVDFARFEKLRTMIDPDRIAVAESGVTNHAEFMAVAELGYDAVLIGSALMREDDPAAALAALRGATILKGSQ